MPSTWILITVFSSVWFSAVLSSWSSCLESLNTSAVGASDLTSSDWNPESKIIAGPKIHCCCVLSLADLSAAEKWSSDNWANQIFTLTEHVTGLKVRDSETAGLGSLKIPAQDCPVCCVSLASREIPAKLKGYFILCGTRPGQCYKHRLIGIHQIYCLFIPFFRKELLNFLFIWLE